MKAVILAGGFGTRLAPITDYIPKPLVPVCGVPVLSHIIKNIHDSGIDECAITLKYMKEKISEKYKSSFCGVNIKYFCEDTPLGTAGSVKNSAEFLDSDFIVLSGDALTDIDLKKVIAYHYEKKSDATIVLTKSENPLNFGIVMCATDGRIKKFIEKPSWNEVFSDTINTGIYILSRKILDFIPENTPFDFSRDLFPLLLENNIAMFGYETSSYWCDIGSVSSFYKCNMDALSGKARLPLAAKPDNSMLSESTVGENFRGHMCKITRSVIFDNVTVSDFSVIDGAIICDNVKIGKNVTIPSGCIVGSEITIEDNIKLSKNTEVIKCSDLQTQVKYNNNIYDDVLDCMDIRADASTPSGIELICRIGRAIGKNVKESIGVMYSIGCDSARLACEAFLCGVKSTGQKSYNFGEGFKSMAGFVNLHYALDIMVYFEGDKNGKISEVRLHLWDKNGLKPKKNFEIMARKSMLSVSCEYNNMKVQNTKEINGIEELYICALTKSVSPLNNITVFLGYSKPCQILKKALISLDANVVNISDLYDYGYSAQQYIYIDIDEACENIKITENGKNLNYSVDKYHIAAIIESFSDKESIKKIALPYYAPPILSEIAAEKGIEIVNYLHYPSGNIKKDDEARELFYANLWLNDPLFAVIKLLDVINCRKLTIAQLMEAMPQFIIKEDNIKIPKTYTSKVMRKLYNDFLPYQKSESDGIIIKYDDNSHINLVCNASGDFRLLSQAYTMEIANDSIAEVKKMIENIIREK